VCVRVSINLSLIKLSNLEINLALAFWLCGM
jgi:hypothetical protein